MKVANFLQSVNSKQFIVIQDETKQGVYYEGLVKNFNKDDYDCSEAQVIESGKNKYDTLIITIRF